MAWFSRASIPNAQCRVLSTPQCISYHVPQSFQYRIVSLLVAFATILRKAASPLSPPPSTNITCHQLHRIDIQNYYAGPAIRPRA